MSFNYPVFFNLAKKDILLIGGGTAAAEKIPALLKTDCALTVISESMENSVSELLKHSSVKVEIRKAKSGDLDGRYMVFYCANDITVGKQFKAYASERKILFNSADDPQNCDFISSAIIERGPITIAMSTGGQFAGFAAMLRRLLETMLPESQDSLIYKLFTSRSQLIQLEKNKLKRREALKKAIKIIEDSYKY